MILSGRLSVREDEAPSLIVENAEPLQPGREPVETAESAKLYLRIRESQREQAQAVLASSPGRVKVYFHDPETKKTYQAPESLWVEAAPALLARLQELLGPENVRMK